MFSEKYDYLDKEITSILRNVNKPSNQLIEHLLEKSIFESLNFKEIASLLESNKEQVEIIKTPMQKNYLIKNNIVKNISPIYLSSYCIDACAYCQFSVLNKDVKRSRLSIDQAMDEVQTVIDEGNNVIEFTLATDPNILLLLLFFLFCLPQMIYLFELLSFILRKCFF